MSKKVGTAVKRNRAKRIIRAAYGELREEIKKGFLIVISAKPEIEGKSSADIAREMRYAMKKLDMFTDEISLGETTSR